MLFSMGSSLSLRERFGLPFMFLLIAGACMYFVTANVRADPLLQYFSPLTWFLIFPYGDMPLRLLESAAGPMWVPWIEGGILFVAWAFIFLLLRGGYYWVRNTGDLSTWQLFGMCVILLFVVCALVMLPVLRQIDLWKASW